MHNLPIPEYLSADLRAELEKDDLLVILIQVNGDGTYSVVTTNQQFLDDTGYDPAFLIGKKVSEVLPEAMYNSLVPRYEIVINSKEPHNYNKESHMPNGVSHYDITIHPVMNEEGEVTHLMGVTRNVMRIT